MNDFFNDLKNIKKDMLKNEALKQNTKETAEKIKLEDDEFKVEFDKESIKQRVKRLQDEFLEYAKDENIKNKASILIRDYYTQKVINAKKAFFVAGSDVLGPMGNELIAFETCESARTFRLEHGGTEIYKFDEITNSVTCALDGRSCE